MIDLTHVLVEGSNPACLTFPITAQFDGFGIVPVSSENTTMSIRTTGTEHWPVVAIDDGEPSQSGTLWVFEQRNGQWYATGAERLRPTQTNGEKPEGYIPHLIGGDWLYDPARWPHLAGYNPPPGTVIGLCVIAGSTRSDDQTPLKARTPVIQIAWPAADGAYPCPILWREGDSGSSIPVPPPTGYDEARSIRFGTQCNAVYSDPARVPPNAPPDGGMIAVHAERDAYDYYAAGLPDPECFDKHVNEFRAVYHLPPL